MVTIAGEIGSSFNTQWQLTCIVAAVELVFSQVRRATSSAAPAR